MKVSELKLMLENIVIDEVKKTIMEEATSKKEVYHIKCEGIPLATFESEEEANDALPDYKEKHKDGELIIEKGVYENHDDMMNKLDEMNDQLEETDDMENTQPMEGNEFSGALKAAKDAGEKTFSVDGKEYDVEECWSKQMEEELVGGQKKLDKNHNGEIDGQDFKIMKGQKSSDEEECEECGTNMEEEKEGGDDFEDMLRGRRRRHYFGQKEYVDGDNGEEEDDDTEYVYDHPREKTDHDPEEMGEEKKCCEKCGKELCECGGMYESKKKTLRLTESELTKMITKMVSESIPGLDAAKKSHVESGKENKKAMADVGKKIKDNMSFEGNDNPEFPKAIGKGEKVARKNTPQQEDEINKNFAGLQNLDYDIEPDEKFKKRLKMAIEGDTLMGNGPTTEKPSITPSNGADKGNESEDKDGNVIATPETAKKLEKQAVDRKKDKDNRELYPKQPVPVKTKQVNEEKQSLSNILEEEIKKMKNIAKYNKKTQ
jgi:hypothetical protein